MNENPEDASVSKKQLKRKLKQIKNEKKRRKTMAEEEEDSSSSTEIEESSVDDEEVMWNIHTKTAISIYTLII